MKILARLVLWGGGIAIFIMLLGWAGESDRNDCEERIAKELSTTAVYINGHCMVKGYGRIDGR